MGKEKKMGICKKRLFVALMAAAMAVTALPVNAQEIISEASDNDAAAIEISNEEGTL